MIYKAGVFDYKHLAPLVNDLVLYHNKIDSTTWTATPHFSILYYLSELSHGVRYYLIQDTDTIAGFFCISRHSISSPLQKSLRTVTLDNIYIIPEFRGKHFGKQALDFIKAVAKEYGASKIKVECYTSNSSAMQFYNQLGFISQYQMLSLDLEKEESFI